MNTVGTGHTPRSSDADERPGLGARYEFLDDGRDIGRVGGGELTLIASETNGR